MLKVLYVIILVKSAHLLLKQVNYLSLDFTFYPAINNRHSRLIYINA